MDKVKIGVIGTGLWANMGHLPSIKSHPQADLVAICGRNQERAAERAAQYGIRETYAEHSSRCPSHRPHMGFIKSESVSMPGDEYYFVVARSQMGTHQTVVGVEVQGDNSTRFGVGKGTRGYFFDNAAGGCHKNICILAKLR